MIFLRQQLLSQARLQSLLDLNFNFRQRRRSPKLNPAYKTLKVRSTLGNFSRQSRVRQILWFCFNQKSSDLIMLYYFLFLLSSQVWRSLPSKSRLFVNSVEIQGLNGNSGNRLWISSYFLPIIPINGGNNSSQQWFKCRTLDNSWSPFFLTTLLNHSS